MKGTDIFKQTIKTYLDNKASTDKLFAVTYAKEDKNIDDCVTYILNQVQESGCNGFADEEIYSMSVHYYDEDNIEVGTTNRSVKVAVNHVVELSQEEKDQLREEAKQKILDQTIASMKDKHKPTKKVEVQQQSSLF